MQRSSSYRRISHSGASRSMPQTPSSPEPEKTPPTDEHRRETLRRLGRGAAYAVPTTLALMCLRRASAASPPT